MSEINQFDENVDYKEKLNEQTKNQFGVFIKYIIDTYKQW